MTDLCHYCAEPIDAAVAVPINDGAAHMHRECMLRICVGSVAHQQRRCPCHGGTEEDAPELSKREAATAAARYWQQRQCPECGGVDDAHQAWCQDAIDTAIIEREG